MQQVVFEEPYKFVPPVFADWWPQIIRRYNRHYLRKSYGVCTLETRHVERYQQSVAAGNSIILAPNHSRLADPLVLGQVAIEAGQSLFAMASWHLYKKSAFQSFMIRRMGAFSVFREGSDRQAIDMAIDILVRRLRPLIVFPEGATSRHNDLVNEMMEGPSFIARQAAKRLKKNGSSGQVVIHPVAIRYAFEGDVEKALLPTLAELEARFSWQPQTHLSMVARIAKIGEALLSLKEVEYLGGARSGNKFERAEHLIETVLSDLERKWNIKDTSGNVIARVKRVRGAIAPAIMTGKLVGEERARYWRDLAAGYYVQQIASYPRDYILPEKNLPERLVETVERLEEDFVDEARVYRPFRAVVEFGEAIPVDAQRDRSAEGDPVMAEVHERLQSMIDGLAAERSPVVTTPQAAKPSEHHKVEQPV